MSVFSNRKNSITQNLQVTDYQPESAWKTHISFEKQDQHQRHRDNLKTEVTNIAIKLANDR